MITRSVEENIRIAFDRFYENLKFKGIILDNTDMQELMFELEENIVIEALSEYTSEVEELKEVAYDDGYERGYEEGADSESYDCDCVYQQGYNDGRNDAYEDGFQAAKEELECTQ